MTGAVLFEHSHRIIAGTSGVLVWLTGLSYFLNSSRNRPQRILISFLMLLILVQSVFGGLTVLWRLPRWVSFTHFVLAQSTLLGMVLLSWSVDRGALYGESVGNSTALEGFDRGLVLVLFLLILGQVVLGGLVRHNGTFGEFVPSLWERGETVPLPCGSFPLCEPSWLQYMGDFYQVLYGVHRWAGYALAAGVAFLAWRIRKQRLRFVSHLAWIAAGLILVQVLLGELSVRSYLAAVPVTLHLAGGVLLMVTLVLIGLEIYRPRWLKSPT